MIAKVIVDILNSEVDKVFDYLIDDNSDIQKGDRVLLPFGNRTIEGYVLDISDTTDLDTSKLKKIIKRLDNFPIIKPELIALSTDLRDKFHLRLIDGIRLVVPAQVRNGKVGSIEVRYLSLNPDENKVDEYFLKIRANAKNPNPLTVHPPPPEPTDWTPSGLLLFVATSDILYVLLIIYW